MYRTAFKRLKSPSILMELIYSLKLVSGKGILQTAGILITLCHDVKKRRMRFGMK